MAGKTKYYEFDGIASYAMLYKPDEFRGKRFWKINLHVDKGTEAEIKAAGIQIKKKTGQAVGVESDEYYTFRRNCEGSWDGKKNELTPPEVLDKDGEKLVTYNRETGDRSGSPVLIGNGSKVRLHVEVYDTKDFGKGCRLRAVQILDLIEYEKPEEVPEKGEDKEVQPSKSVEPVKTEKKKVSW